MKTIKVGDKEIILNIWEEITIREFRKIQPIIKEKQSQEIEMIISIIMSLSDDKDIEEKLNWLNIEEFTKLSEEITKLLQVEKKTQK